MRFRKRIDPLKKYFIFAVTYFIIVSGIAAYLHYRIITSINPGGINTRIEMIYRDKIVQYGLEKNITEIYIEGIPITTDYDNPYSKNATMNNGYVIRFEPGTSDDEIKVISEMYNSMYRDEILLRKRMLWIVAPLALLLPCIIVYGIGWKSRWWVKSGGKVVDITATSVRGKGTRGKKWKRSTSVYYKGD